MSWAFSYAFVLVLTRRPLIPTAARGCKGGWLGGAGALGGQHRSAGSGLLTGLRGTAAGMREEKAATGKKKLRVSVKKIHRSQRLKNCPGKLKSPRVPTAAPGRQRSSALCGSRGDRQGLFLLFFFFFPVEKSPALGRVVSKPHTVRHPQG